MALIKVTFKVVDETGSALEKVRIDVFDVSGRSYVATMITDSSGSVTRYLNASTDYKIWIAYEKRYDFGELPISYSTGSGSTETKSFMGRLWYSPSQTDNDQVKAMIRRNYTMDGKLEKTGP